MQRIYMDHSATTPVAPEVVEAMLEALTDGWGNPSSLHAHGKTARAMLEKARRQVADLIGADPREIVFTSGGTEADNLAIIGSALAAQKRGRHLITSTIEHHAVFHAFRHLAQNGFDVTVLPVDYYGRVNPDHLREMIREDTVLISIMHANNEIGTVQPLEEIGDIARQYGITLHTDAVQSMGRIPVKVNELKVDLLSLSAHKFYGPKGAGALYIRSGASLIPLAYGGGQEKKRRSGTENIPGIVGMGQAAEIAGAQLDENIDRLTRLGQILIKRVQEEIPQSYLTGHPQFRLPGHASFVFPGVEGDAVVNFLDAEGIAASSASACRSNSFQASHVLTALGLKNEVALGSLRLSLGRANNMDDVERLMQILPGLVERSRLIWSLSQT